MHDTVRDQLRANLRAERREHVAAERVVNRKQIVSLVGTGIVFFALAVALYFYFADWEESGGRRRMNAWILLAYSVLGKGGVAAAMSAIGLGCLAVAFYRLSDAVASTGLLIQGIVAVALGIAFVGLGIYEYSLLDRFETRGGLQQAHWLHAMADNAFGKFGVLAFGLVGGLSLGGAGLYLMFSRQEESPEN
jgi:heme/copper-type cytochrome/quinol oxidase subunit 3